MPPRLDFPILVREWRSRFRRARSFVTLGALVTGAAWICWRNLASGAGEDEALLAVRAQSVLLQLVWMQILGVCLLAPLECAPLIAREREIGVGDELLLAPMAPWRVALEKGAAGAGFIALALLALLPFDLIALLGSSGAGAPTSLWALAALLLGCLAWGAALGTACSAHSRRASSASRSALGLALLWLLGSFGCALFAGEMGMWGRLGFGAGAPFYVVWFGRTNPILAGLDLLFPSPYEAKWPFCAAFLLGGTGVLWWLAARGLVKPLPDLPLLSPRRGANGVKAGGVSGALARLEMPLVGRFAPRNPVLGREVRGKFRLRQPPLAVLVSEIVLGVLVAGAYLLLVRQALVDPLSRPVIFWGVAWSGLSVALLGAIASGAGALSRERENGTWDALRLSLLSPAQIVRGKLLASLCTSVALSFPVWPLLLLSVDWRSSWTPRASGTQVQPFQLLAGIVIWLGVLWLQTLLAMLIGTRAKKAGSATGAATLLSLGWMFGSLFLLLDSYSDAVGFLGVTNPLVSLSLVTDPASVTRGSPHLWLSTGWPFALFALLVGALTLVLVESEVRNTLEADADQQV